eukprot:GILK01012574.1.p1 GENE.GILK01012574.1~~GILK01012574.1.p1  ORF type:complete len:132 (-),score=15.62 GILK01012574.1:343-738(-)
MTMREHNSNPTFHVEAQHLQRLVVQKQMAQGDFETSKKCSVLAPLDINILSETEVISPVASPRKEATSGIHTQSGATVHVGSSNSFGMPQEQTLLHPRVKQLRQRDIPVEDTRYPSMRLLNSIRRRQMIQS